MSNELSVYEVNPERRKDWEWLIGNDEDLAKDLIEASQGARKHKPRKEQLDYARVGMEILLENTKKQIADEHDRKMHKLGAKEFYEEVDTSSIAIFTRYALPLIRRVFPRLYATSLVGVQPIPTPTAKVFYLDTKYGTTKYPTTAGDRLDLTTTMNKSYGGARKTVSATGDGVTVAFNLGHYGAKNLKVYSAGVLLTTGYTHAAGGTSAATDTVTFSVAPTLAVALLFVFDNVAEGDTARDIDMSMSSLTIEAEAIKLRSVMTVESMQDFAAYHGLQSEIELTNAMAGEVAREIDLNILERLFFNAGAGNTNWDSAGYLVGDDNTFYQKEYRKTLYEAIVATNNLIYRKRFVNASWIVGGVGFCERMEKLEQFNINTELSAPDDASVARRYEGTLAGKWKIYKDARLADTTALLGFNGDTPFQTGAVFAPYIPAYMTDLMPDPNVNFKMRKGIMSRFGYATLIPDCYATLTIV
jgi:hypothetical protein